MEMLRGAAPPAAPLSSQDTEEQPPRQEEGSGEEDAVAAGDELQLAEPVGSIQFDEPPVPPPIHLSVTSLPYSTPCPTVLQVRAVIVGLLVGGLMCFSNMYFGLQTGESFYISGSSER